MGRAGTLVDVLHKAAATKALGLLSEFGVGDEALFHFFLFLSEAGGEEFFSFG